MVRGVIFSIIIGVAIGLMVSLPEPAEVEQKDTGLGEDYAWKDFSPYRILSTPRENDFDLTFPVKNLAGKAGPVSGLRILLHYTDRENYAAITIGKDYTSIDEVVSGLVLPRASVRTAITLAANQNPVFRVKWRQPYLTLLRDGNLVIAGTLTTLSRGQVGVGTANTTLKPGELVVQPVVPIAFSDDFMRGKNDPSPWEPTAGHWQVRSLDNPSRSANSFVYQAIVPEGGASFIGSEYWDNYRVEASVCGSQNSAAGLIFNAYGKDDAFIFRWGARSGDEKSTPAANSLQLVRLQGGKETIIKEKPGGYRPEQWMRLKVLANNGQAACYIDGNLIFQYSSPRLYGGRAGLYAYGKRGVDFDDFLVRSYRGKLAGTSAEEAATEYETLGDTVLYGQSSWNGYTLSAVVEPDLEAAAANKQVIALVAAYQSPMDYVLYEVTRGAGGGFRQTLLRIKAEGRREVLEQSDLSKDAFNRLRSGGGEIPVKLALDAGVISVSLGDLPRLYGYLGNAAAGRCGFQGATAARHRKVAIRPLEPVLPLVTVNEVFDEESMMKAWSGVAGEWREEISGSKHYDHIYWHRTRLYDQAQIEALIPAQPEGAKPLFTTDSELALSLAKPAATSKKKNGYMLRYQPLLQKQQQLQLLRAGEEVGTYGFSGPAHIRRLRLRQKGPFVIAYADDDPKIVYRDPEPLAGQKVAWAVRDFPLPAEDVLIYSKNLKNYLFSQAPVDWRIGAGVWEVTNRWECDWRWNFWAGMPGRLAKRRANSLARNSSRGAEWKVQDLLRQVRLLPDARDKHTVLWHKGEFSGDLTVDIYLAQMHDQSRGGGQYNLYARDFNITVCADGRDLSSGYSCIFGGWKNTKSAIMRKNEIVVEEPVKLPLSGSHRRWVRMCVRKENDTIYFDAYSQLQAGRPEQHLLSLQYTDPDPLPGKHLAIWSYDNGILISRARISAQEIGPYDNPTETWPARIKSAYSSEK